MATAQDKTESWYVEATDEQGIKHYSWHTKMPDAVRAASIIKGRYPYGKRVKVLYGPAPK